ncbi:1-acyl-sn-glycerol-3-phosphate acyltransferase [Ramlibacter sp. G-1-2-2]|uniref:1-acyl-sn-glycerol-3-phosphate acyltransferase n=2 Tax=Ramlibacter agri TaxID=2728837 RepID=A0A848HB49_9BURK|nr:1-acyl-sn-glycerol-3-phosphate acyltransferase [Ramlibacter agri]
MAGVSIEETGRRAVGPVMLVSNHVSWLDMIAIQCLCPTRFIAKSEVRAWPVIGAIASRLGTIYIDRQSSRSAAAAVGSVAAHLRAGEIVVLFPEGTTTDGTGVQPFRGSLLQAPIDAQARVQPVALIYRESDTGLICRRASYTGSDGLLESIWRTVSARVTVRIAFGPALDTDGQNRRSLALSLHSQVEELRAS